MDILAQVRDPSGGEISGDVATIQGFEWIFQNIISIALELAGVVFFIMILIGGFKYLTAGGDPKSAESAKKTLTYAVAGLVVLALAFLILTLIKKITGVNITEFNVYLPK
jgi:TRAP-type C4-dicarboxylate transport system permease small subunit